MTPDPAIRLQSVLNTFSQVIVPAIDPNNALAVEQCGVMAAQLAMLIEHMPMIGAYHRTCLNDLAQIVDGLPEAAGGPQTMAAAETLAADRAQARDATDDRAAFHQLGLSLERLMRAAAADGDPAYRRQVDGAVLAFSERQSLRSRSWFNSAGFDHCEAEVPPIAELLA
ncbi:hypothetical protein [Sphingomonas sp. ID0503]|uniref:hypothetical protein n=1 Tax=Sphingomonas sp. ID0503 TaxID=3399691 RepID=UPI003AFA6159